MLSNVTPFASARVPEDPTFPLSALASLSAPRNAAPAPLIRRLFGLRGEPIGTPSRAKTSAVGDGADQQSSFYPKISSFRPHCGWSL